MTGAILTVHISDEAVEFIGDLGEVLFSPHAELSGFIVQSHEVEIISLCSRSSAD